MSDRRLFVEIEVGGNGAKVFQAIGQAAKTAAQDVMQSGDRASRVSSASRRRLTGRRNKSRN